MTPFSGMAPHHGAVRLRAGTSSDSSASAIPKLRKERDDNANFASRCAFPALAHHGVPHSAPALTDHQQQLVEHACQHSRFIRYQHRPNENEHNAATLSRQPGKGKDVTFFLQETGHSPEMHCA